MRLEDIKIGDVIECKSDTGHHSIWEVVANPSLFKEGGSGTDAKRDFDVECVDVIAVGIGAFSGVGERLSLWCDWLGDPESAWSLFPSVKVFSDPTFGVFD